MGIHTQTIRIASFDVFRCFAAFFSGAALAPRLPSTEGATVAGGACCGGDPEDDGEHVASDGDADDPNPVSSPLSFISPLPGSAIHSSIRLSLPRLPIK